MERTRAASETLERLRDGLIVSCQPKAPLADPETVAAMAQAAVLAGAVGIRADGGANVAAVRRRVSVPIVGIKKERTDGSAVYITPTLATVREVLAAGAEIVGLDGTAAPRPEGAELRDLVDAIHGGGALVLADVSTVAEGIAAAAAGADAVATTLAGYTPQSRRLDGPDLALVDELRRATRLPVVAEGRYHTPAEVAAAFALGALAVVVGRAITEPQFLTRRFVAGTPRARGPQGA